MILERETLESYDLWNPRKDCHELGVLMVFRGEGKWVGGTRLCRPEDPIRQQPNQSRVTPGL